VRPWRKKVKAAIALTPKKPASQCPSSKRVSWWLLQDEADLTPEENAFLDRLWELCHDLKAATELAREFSDTVRNRMASWWEAWLTKVREPGVAREFQRFADGLKQDEAAVKRQWGWSGAMARWKVRSIG
jgi:transposase